MRALLISCKMMLVALAMLIMPAPHARAANQCHGAVTIPGVIAEINACITTNGAHQITGAVVNGILNDIVNLISSAGCLPLTGDVTASLGTCITALVHINAGSVTVTGVFPTSSDPALTGDATKSGGSSAVTVTKIGGVVPGPITFLNIGQGLTSAAGNLELSPIAAGNMLGNITGATAVPQAVPLASMFALAPALSIPGSAVWYQQSGTGAIPVTLSAAQINYNYTPEQFGAVGDASTDDTVNLNKAIDAANNAACAYGGATLQLKRAYLISNQIAPSSAVCSGLAIIGTTDAAGFKLTGSATGISALLLAGPGFVGSPINITTNASYGANQIVLASVVGLSVGDVIQIYNLTGGSDSGMRGQVSQITNIAGSTITVAPALQFAINTANTAQVQKVSVTSRLLVDNIHFTATAQTGTVNAFFAEFLRNSRITNIYVSGYNSFNTTGISLYTCLTCYKGEWHTTTSGFVGVSPNSSNAQQIEFASGGVNFNMTSFLDAGFGLVFNRVSGEQFSNMSARYAGARGVKLFSASGNEITNVVGDWNGSTTANVAITAGSSNNRLYNVEAIGGAAECLWFNGTGNINNTVNGVVSFGCLNHDVYVATTAPLADTGNVVTGIDPRALNIQVDAGSAAVLSGAGGVGTVAAVIGTISPTVLVAPAGGSGVLQRGDGTWTNTLTGQFVAFGMVSSPTTNFAPYASVFGSFGGISNGEAYVGQNAYWDNSSTYRTIGTFGGGAVGYGLLKLGLNGVLGFAGSNAATTGGASITPTFLPVGVASAATTTANRVPFWSSTTGGLNSTGDITDNGTGNVGMGTETNPQAPLVVSSNVTTGVSPVSAATGISIVGKDAQSTFLEINSFGASFAPFIIMRQSGGTAASKTQSLNGNQLGGYLFEAYNSSNAYQASTEITTQILENCTATACGANLLFYGTTIGTVGIANGFTATGTGAFLPPGKTLGQMGSSSGTISFLAQAAAGTYNWNWPTTAGSSGTLLTSGGGTTNPETWSTVSTGLTLSGGNLTSNAKDHITWQPGTITSVAATKADFHKFSKASTVGNIEGSASLFTCSVNPTITVFECGTSLTCSSSPVTIGTVTLTTTGAVVDGTVSNGAITAGDYVAFALTAGTCTSLLFYTSLEISSN